MVINADKIEAKRKSRDLPRQIMRLNDDIEGVTNGKRLNELISLWVLRRGKKWETRGTMPL